MFPKGFMKYGFNKIMILFRFISIFNSKSQF
ncbi:MAG: hypothetical protein JWR38_5031 [Mucilaginibacter sp.]|nr:hypothetical protein [Mucilaginibacter sp.]